MTKKIAHNPGSKKAIAAGCLCPVMDNEYGRGYMGQPNIFMYNGACPIHTGRLTKQKKQGDNETER